MSFDKFSTLTTSIVALPIENVDTDQIIPARFLKSVNREGFGENLFRDWRYDYQDNPVKDFILNDKNIKGEVLVAGRNFGCGSSREHAAWAIYDYGFRAVISSSFADIFKNNALNIGLLPVEVSDEFLSKILRLTKEGKSNKVFIDLEGQEVEILETGEKEYFDLSDYKKKCLQNGYDDIDYLLTMRDEIEAFEEKYEEETIECAIL